MYYYSISMYASEEEMRGNELTKWGCCVLQGVRVGVFGQGGCEGLEGRGLVCPVCNKTFCSRNRRQDLQRHILSHTGERPFACSYCPYRATLKGNLKKHVHGLHAHLFTPPMEKIVVSEAANSLTSPLQSYGQDPSCKAGSEADSSLTSPLQSHGQDASYKSSSEADNSLTSLQSYGQDTS